MFVLQGVPCQSPWRAKRRYVQQRMRFKRTTERTSPPRSRLRTPCHCVLLLLLNISEAMPSSIDGYTSRSALMQVAHVISSWSLVRQDGEDHISCIGHKVQLCPARLPVCYIYYHVSIHHLPICYSGIRFVCFRKPD